MKILALEGGADIRFSNSYGQTALILATEGDHIGVVKWLTNYRPTSYDAGDQLSVKNMYSKNAFVVACEFGKDEIVAWILCIRGEEFKNSTNSRGITALMFSSIGKNPRKHRIAQLLVASGAAVDDRRNPDGDSALLWACLGGTLAVVKLLIEAGADVNVVNKKGMSAIKQAVQSGNLEVVKLLQDRGAQHCPFHLFKIALSKGHVDIGILFIVKLKDMLGFFPHDPDYFFSVLELTEMATFYATSDSSVQLMAAAARFDMVLNLFVRLLSRMPSPIAFLQKHFTPFFHSLKATASLFCNPDTHDYGPADADLLHKLVLLINALRTAAKYHPGEAEDLQEWVARIELMVQRCFASDCMADEEGFTTAMNCVLMRYSSKNTVPLDRVVMRASGFLIGPLRNAIKHEVKSFFCPLVSKRLDQIFWSFTRRSLPKTQRLWDPAAAVTHTARMLFGKEISFSHESCKLLELRSNFIYPRYSPAFSFFLEGTSKCLCLALIAAVIFDYESGRQHFSKKETQLIIFWSLNVLYEYGELCGPGYQLWPTAEDGEEYLSETWNLLDLAGLLAVAVWLGVRATAGDELLALASLSVAPLVLSMALLQYLSGHEPLGKLVIMVFGMTSGLFCFLLLWLFVTSGHAIVLVSLFKDRGVASFSSFQQAVLTLFSTSLGNFDGSFTDTFPAGLPLQLLGIGIQMSYIVFSVVLLFNLVVANMSANFSRLYQNSFHEWQFTRAASVCSFVLLEERHPFCMLPPPLNLLPVLLSPLHFHSLYRNYFSKVKAVQNMQHYKFSSVAADNIAGTASDQFMAIILSPVAPLVEYFLYIFKAKFSVEYFLFVLLFLMLYVAYWIALLMEALCISSPLSIENRDLRRPDVLVRYEQTPVRLSPRVEKCSDMWSMSVEISKAYLFKASLNSNVVVRVVVGDQQLESETCPNSGPSVQWSEPKELIFPLARFDPMTEGMSLQVLDRVMATGEELLLGEYRSTPGNLLPWLATQRNEGSMALDDGAGFVYAVFVVNASFKPWDLNQGDMAECILTRNLTEKLPCYQRDNLYSAKDKDCIFAPALDPALDLAEEDQSVNDPFAHAVQPVRGMTSPWKSAARLHIDPSLLEEQPSVLEEQPSVLEEQQSLLEEQPSVLEKELSVLEEELRVLEEQHSLLEQQSLLED